MTWRPNSHQCKRASRISARKLPFVHHFTNKMYLELKWKKKCLKHFANNSQRKLSSLVRWFTWSTNDIHYGPSKQTKLLQEDNDCFRDGRCLSNCWQDNAMLVSEAQEEDGCDCCVPIKSKWQSDLGEAQRGYIFSQLLSQGCSFFPPVSI